MPKRLLATLVGFIAFGALILQSAPDVANAAPVDKSAAAQSDSFAQARRRPHIRINRGYPYRTFQAVYPLPYDIEYPGANGVRQCANRYVAEHRVAGTVLVPHMRCWWVVRR
jgi:hypothetical protein